MNNLETRLTRIEQEIQNLKTSQSLGQSNSKIYYVGKITGSITKNGETFLLNFRFISSGRPFPKVMIKANYFTRGGTDITSQFHTNVLEALYVPSDPYTAIYLDPQKVYLQSNYFYVSGTTTYAWDLEVYADTPGMVSVSTDLGGNPFGE